MTATLALCAVLLVGTEIPRGSSHMTVDLGGTPLELFTYKPESYRNGPMILVFHGVLRNADEYRDHARGMGDRFGALIVSPKFDVDSFPTESYQQGGLLRDGKMQPAANWTWQLVAKVADEIRRREGRPDMSYYLIGHSGGGQFLIRLSGFVDPGAKRIVVSNPGTYLFPSRDQAYPYGYGKLPEDISNDDALQRYLAQPITLYLGMNDTERDEHLDQSPEGDRQGTTRWERGQSAFRAAQRLANERGWPFNWRVVTVPGVGHDHEKMFDHALAADALFGPQSGNRTSPSPTGRGPG